MPSNTLLTDDIITKEAMRILHQKLNFVGCMNRDYDDRFARTGAKIGDTLRIRLPVQYTVTDGATMVVQDSEQQSFSLPVTNRKHVGMDFSDEEMTLDIDKFAELHLEPAMAVLAAKVESDVINTLYKTVYNQVDNIGAGITLKNVGQVRKKLVDNLAPPNDGKLCFISNTTDNLELVDQGKALFNPSDEISMQYRDGYMGKHSAFKFYENTLMPRHTTGTAAASTGYLVNGAGQTGATLTVDGGTNTLLTGDIFTMAGVFRVHPETKVNTGELQQFVVTADSGASATSLSISPGIITSGGQQNVSNSPADDAPITKVGGASASHDISMAFHRDAFVFATADLEMPRNIDQASRQVYDGLSIRYTRDWDQITSRFLPRIDILYGFAAARPQLACRAGFN